LVFVIFEGLSLDSDVPGKIWAMGTAIGHAVLLGTVFSPGTDDAVLSPYFFTHIFTPFPGPL
jgi:hypothetical protein